MKILGDLDQYSGYCWRRKWQPTPVFLPGKSHGRRNLVRLQSMGLQRVGHNWATSLTHSFRILYCRTDIMRQNPWPPAFNIGKRNSWEGSNLPSRLAFLNFTKFGIFLYFILWCYNQAGSLVSSFCKCRCHNLIQLDCRIRLLLILRLNHSFVYSYLIFFWYFS